MFKQFETQFEILIEGFNPYAAGPLSAAELSSARAALQPQEHLTGFVRGRVPGAAAALWVLTEQRLLLLKEGRKGGATALDLARVQRIEHERGKFGTTLAVHADGQRHALIGTDPDLAQVFALALGRSVAPGLAPQITRALTAGAAAEVATWVSWSRLRLMPAAHEGMGEGVVMLREAAELHQRGLLGDAELDALKGQLLQAA